jgi:uncharacterized protein (DUF2147 family)
MIMKNYCLTATLALILVSSANAQTTPTSPLTGTWRSEDYTATVRVAPCTNGAGMCATVIAEQLEPGTPSQLNQIVLQSAQPRGRNEWRGTYLADGQSMAARIRLPTPNRMTVRVCALAFLCDTITLNRV